MLRLVSHLLKELLVSIVLLALGVSLVLEGSQSS